MSADPYHVVFSGFQASPIPWSMIVSYPNPDDPRLAGPPYDVSGWTVLFTAKKNATDADDDALYKSDWVMPVGSIDGKIGGELPNTVTVALDPCEIPFDVKLIIPPSTAPQMFLRGKFDVGLAIGKRLIPVLT